MRFGSPEPCGMLLCKINSFFLCKRMDFFYPLAVYKHIFL